VGRQGYALLARLNSRLIYYLNTDFCSRSLHAMKLADFDGAYGSPFDRDPSDEFGPEEIRPDQYVCVLCCR
jgi:hypothetical protein